MTVQDIAALTEVIRKTAEQGDYEVAHGMEDTMLVKVLTAIANGQGDSPYLLARAALQSQRITFARHCA